MASPNTQGRGWDSVKRRATKGGKPTGALKAYTEAYRHTTTILGDVQAYLLAESLKPDSTHHRKGIYPSELSKGQWCERQTFYRLSDTPPSNPLPSSNSFQLEAIFEEGHNIHTKWQTWLRNMGRLWGEWECTHCHNMFFGTSPSNCPKCNSDVLIYREVSLTEGKENGIVGHADGAIPDINALIEIKSVGLGTLRMENPTLLAEYQVKTENGGKLYDLDALWRNLSSPFPSHLRQGNIYLYMCKLMGLPYDRIVFLYEFKATQAVKEFTVKMSDTVMEPLLDRMAGLHYSLGVGVPPPRPSFTGEDTKICKTCPWFTHCYQSQEAGDYKRGSQASLDRLGGTAPARGVGIARTKNGAEALAAATNTTGRPDGVLRQGTDAPAVSADELVIVGGTGSSAGRGRREVHRKPAREGQG